MARKVTTPNSDYFSGGPNYKLPSAYTILFRAKINSVNGGVLFGGRITDGWWVDRNSNSGIGVMHAGIASASSNNGICPNDNTWHAYAITYDGTARFYADDTTVRGSGAISACVSPPGYGIYIGANNDNTYPVWAGDHALAEIALFSRKLSDAELGQWMSGDAPNLYSTNLDHYWRLDETSGGAAATVGGYNLTQVGTMASVTHPAMNYSSGATATVTGTTATPAFSGSSTGLTVLFHSDFEDSSGTIVVPSGAAGFTVNGQYLVFDASIVSLSAVSGARIMASSDNADLARYTASGSLTSQAVRHASKWQSHSTPHVSGHVLRYVDASSFYYVYPQTDGSSLRLIAFRYEGGSAQIAVTSYVLACSVGDVIHHESKMVGTTIESRIWKNSESRPSTATLSVTDSNYSSGYPGFIKIGANGTYAAMDNVVITDGAGGEDYFYPESSGPTTAQPSAGTSLPSTSLTSGLVFARNEADTTASTVLAGSVSILGSPVDGTAYGTDAQGRYKYYNTNGQWWSGVTTGTEYTVLHIVKHVSNGSDQCLSSWDENPPRRFILKLDTDGKVFASTFRATDTYAGDTTKSTNTASTSGYSTVVFRVKNDAGTYKAQCFIDGTAASALTLGGTAEGLPSLSLAMRSGGGNTMTTDRMYFSAVWDRALTDTEITTDLSNGWAIFDTPAAGSTATITGTTATPAFSGSAQVSPEASITVTTASPTFSGGASSGVAEATITATTESPAFSGSATGDTSQGTLTLPVLKNNTGTILANETGATVHVYAVSTGNKIVTKTGQATNGSGVMTVSDALIVAATQYRVVVVLGSGAEGLDKVTAA